MKAKWVRVLTLASCLVFSGPAKIFSQLAAPSA